MKSVPPHPSKFSRYKEVNAYKYPIKILNFKSKETNLSNNVKIYDSCFKARVFQHEMDHLNAIINESDYFKVSPRL